MFKNKKLITISIIALNLLGSGLICYAGQTNSSVSVDPCEDNRTSNCIYISAPTSLSRVTDAPTLPYVFDNAANSIYFYSINSLTNGIRIVDARTVGNFFLDVTMSSLKDANENPIIPYNNFSIVSFNESNSSSLDGYTLGGIERPTSLLDPVYKSTRNVVQFNEADFNSQALNNSLPSNYFISFNDSGTGDTSTPLNVISANSAPGYSGTYQFGVGLKLDLPANSVENLGIRDNIYHGNLTFTLTTSSIIP